MNIKELYIKTYRRYKIYAERHGIEVKIKQVKHPTRASIKRVEDEHKKNKIMQSTYRWIERVKINKRKKEREKKKIEKEFKDAEKLLKRLKRKEKKGKEKKRKDKIIADAIPDFNNGYIYTDSVLDAIDTAMVYWMGAYTRGNVSTVIDNKVYHLYELKNAINAYPKDEMEKILKKTAGSGRLVYEEIMDYIELIHEYSSGQEAELNEEGDKAIRLLKMHTDNKELKEQMETRAKKSETTVTGLRPGKTILDGKVEDFF